ADSAVDKHAARKLREFGKGQVAELEAAEEEICFGRIDPEDERELYIGRSLITDGATPVVISWQADKARPLHTATGEDPHGLLSKRAFTLDGRRLVRIDEQRFVEGAPPEFPSDALLAELERDRTSEMRDIVKTIQADQYDLIRRNLDAPLVIQGGPGT